MEKLKKFTFQSVIEKGDIVHQNALKSIMGGYGDDGVCVAWCNDYEGNPKAYLWLPGGDCNTAYKECVKNGWQTVCHPDCFPY